MDKNALLGQTVPQGTVDLPGIGTITVRGLTRYEMAMVAKGDVPDEVRERRTLAITMVDPPMTETDVEQWQKVSPAAQINTVALEVNKLSGIGKHVEKEAYKSVRDGSGA